MCVLANESSFELWKEQYIFFMLTIFSGLLFCTAQVANITAKIINIKKNLIP